MKVDGEYDGYEKVMVQLCTRILMKTDLIIKHQYFFVEKVCVM